MSGPAAASPTAAAATADGFAALLPAGFAQWLAGARGAAQQPPVQSRLPFVVAGEAIGSVSEGFLDQIGPERLSGKRWQLSIDEHAGGPAWHLRTPPQGATAALNALAGALRERDLCGPWRNEQLAVHTVSGQVLGTIERGAVRVLGIATRAVHLVGTAPDGRVWLQKRSLTKPNNPGLWDTLMGGMVSAADTLAQALARETWEEAGLRIETLAQLRHGGCVDFSRPSREGGGVGYMRERIDWFSAQLPAGVQPCNQDGEVERFELLAPGVVRERLAHGLVTLEAGLVLADFLGH